MAAIYRHFSPMFAWVLVVLTMIAGPAGAAPDRPTSRPSADFSKTYLLHLPGVAGKLGIDDDLIDGLKDGGYAGRTKIYDWTGDAPGIDALFARKQNLDEARKIAKTIAAKLREEPDAHVILTAHSGGAG